MSAITSYLETALWSSARCNEDGNHIGSMDDEYGIGDFDIVAREQAETDLDGFFEAAAEWLEGHEDEQVAHDFWLTRNRHGAGFWDGDYEHGDKLTELAHAYGSTDVIEIGDGKVSLS